MVRVECFVLDRDGVRVAEEDVDTIVLIQVGREIRLPSRYEGVEVRNARAIRQVKPEDFPVVARNIVRVIEDVPSDRRLAVVPSGALAINVLWAVFVGFNHRVFLVGQWNPERGDYDWFKVSPSIRDFFLGRD